MSSFLDSLGTFLEGVAEEINADRARQKRVEILVGGGCDKDVAERFVRKMTDSETAGCPTGLYRWGERHEVPFSDRYERGFLCETCGGWHIHPEIWTVTS